MDSQSDEGFVQDYRLGKPQDLYIYCRLCRRTFPVSFKPKRSSVRLRCLCGHEAPLAQLDVFATQQEAEDHAAFYENVYQVAKSALVDAGLDLPPSGKYRCVEDIQQDSTFQSFYSDQDESAIRDGYVPMEESDTSSQSIAAGLAEFEDRLDEARDDVVELHEVLTELIEWSFCRRYFDDEVRERFRQACVEDIRAAKSVAKEARRRKKQGLTVRVTFTSFKHLAIDLEEDEEYMRALKVVEKAIALGLKGYDARAEDLRHRLRGQL